MREPPSIPPQKRLHTRTLKAVASRIVGRVYGCAWLPWLSVNAGVLAFNSDRTAQRIYVQRRSSASTAVQIFQEQPLNRAEAQHDQ